MNRARWDAASSLIEQRGISPVQIDGGFEFNNLWPNRRLIEQGGADGIIDRIDVPYKLTFGPMPDHETVGRVACHPWLPCAVREIFILRRNNLP